MTKPLVDIMNISGVTDTITGNAYNDLTVLATDVTAFRVTVWPAVPLTRLVRFQLTVGTGSSAVTLRSAASTRAGATGYVQVVENEYVLTSPD